MGYESSASKRELPKAWTNSAKKLHSLRSADIKLSDARADPGQSIRNNKTLLTTKRQLRNALALAQQNRCSDTAANEFRDQKAHTAHLSKRTGPLLTTKRQLQNALTIAQKTDPVLPKTNKFKGRKATTQVGVKMAGQRSGRFEINNSSKIEADKTMAPVIGCDVEATALYMIKESPGRGLGLFAFEDIRKGARILAEEPFFSLAKRPVLSLSDIRAPNDISKAFDSLSVGDQRHYLDLHCPERPGLTRGISIYEANCYEMGAGTCICMDGSRINHSCIPNAHYSWNSSIRRVTVHAVKDILMDEEITISYCSAMHNFEERQRELEPYIFACNCPACQTDTEFSNQSRIRRQQMRDLDQQIAGYGNDPPAAGTERDHRDEETTILKLIALIDEEGLVYEKSLAYRDAAECALRRGLTEEALIYASKELDVVFRCVGRDSAYYDETIAYIHVPLGKLEPTQ